MAAVQHALQHAQLVLIPFFFFLAQFFHKSCIQLALVDKTKGVWHTLTGFCFLFYRNISIWHDISHISYNVLAKTNTPRPAAGMALFQPRDWFSAAQLSLSFAIRIVCQKMDECNLLKSISTIFHFSINSYRYRLIAQP